MAKHVPSSTDATREAAADISSAEASTLPSDQFPIGVEKAGPAEAPALPKAPSDLVAALDVLINHLMLGPTYWKAGVPEFGDRWQPIYEQVLGGQRAVAGEPNVDRAREFAKTKEVLVRIYQGATSHEKILVVRAIGTTYVKAQVLPWTIGK